MDRLKIILPPTTDQRGWTHGAITTFGPQAAEEGSNLVGLGVRMHLPWDSRGPSSENKYVLR
jgi:hypothetical protein